MDAVEIRQACQRAFEQAPSESEERSVWWGVWRTVCTLEEYNRKSIRQLLQNRRQHVDGVMLQVINKVLGWFDEPEPEEVA